MPHAEQVTARCSFHGEGPFWDGAATRLRFVDMLAGDVVTLLPTGTVTRRHVGDVAAVIRARSRGGYVVAVERGFALFDSEWQVERIVAAFRSNSQRMNEGNCDPQGRMYCGSMDYGAAPGGGSLYRLDPDLSVHLVLDSVSIPNGLQWSADGARVFHADTTTGRIDVLDFDSTAGIFLNRRPFIAFDGTQGAPDGTAIDEEGGLWVALWGGGAVHRYDESGKLTDVVQIPVTNVTACTFAGTGSSELFITTSMQDIDPVDEPAAGALFRVEVGTRGVEQAEFLG